MDLQHLRQLRAPCADERPPEDAHIRLIAVRLQNWLGCSSHWGGNAGEGTEDDCAASFRDATPRAFLRGGGETGPDRDGDDLIIALSILPSNGTQSESGPVSN
jgi:hypothetical protein